MNKKLIPIPLFIDLDGVVLDTDGGNPLSAKGKETLSLIQSFTNVFDTHENFAKFYTSFNKKCAGQTFIRACEILWNELKNRGVEVPGFLEFSMERLAQREKTYAERAIFMGEGGRSAEEWLSKIRSPYRLYLVSNVLRKHYRLVEKRLRLSRFFHERNIVLGDDVENKKPSPEPYEAAMKKARVKGNASGFGGIAFEDSPAGIAAAAGARENNARLFVVGIETSASSSELISAGAHLTFTSLCSVDLDMVSRKAGF
jgi:beta-phosphoglucomutase-like phosphatase (HAD superfamily)